MPANEHAISNFDEFDKFFKQAPVGRGEFLSRLFGLFNEEVVKHWCLCPWAPYDSLGRPTLREKGTAKPYVTLDFTLRHRSIPKTFAAEMKCELQFASYQYLRLTSIKQLDHHITAQSPAFRWFLRLAQSPDTFDVRVAGKSIPIDGTILIWGAIAPEGREAVMAEHAVSDVLSIEDMLRDLRKLQPPHWTQRIAQLRQWSNDLFDFLA